MSENVTEESGSEEIEMAEVNGAYGEVVPDRYTFVAPKATRFEIYPAGGGAAHIMTLEPGASIHIQDNGRTIKIFSNARADLKEWFEENHDFGKAKAKDSKD